MTDSKKRLPNFAISYYRIRLPKEGARETSYDFNNTSKTARQSAAPLWSFLYFLLFIFLLITHSY